MNYVTKLWKKAKENVEDFSYLNWVSDIESYSKKKLKAMYTNHNWGWTEEHEVKYANGSHSIEWETVYGRYWESFDTAEDLEKALAENKAIYEAELRSEYNRLLSERKERIKAHRESRNSLGNLFPELSKLK